jgi:hypothetical protein
MVSGCLLSVGIITPFAIFELQSIVCFGSH